MATTKITIIDTKDGVEVRLDSTEEMSLCDAVGWTEGQRLGAQIYIGTGVPRLGLEGMEPEGSS